MVKYFKEIVERADVYQWFDWRDCTLHFYSVNKKAPLTELEKAKILIHLSMDLDYPYAVIFDN